MKDLYQLTSYNNNYIDLLVSYLMKDHNKSYFKWIKHVMEGNIYIMLIQIEFQT